MRLRLPQVMTAVLISVLALSSGANAQQAVFKISGDAVVGEDTILVGEEFSLDLYLSNVEKQNGFTLGFILSGKKGFKGVRHVQPDSVDKAGENVTAHNGFEDKSIWDMTGIMKPVFSWDGEFPDSILLGGIALNKGWEKTDLERYVSIAMEAKSTGHFCIDSAFIPPGGSWMYADQTEPVWEGPYCFTVVKKKAKEAEEAKEAKQDEGK